MMKMEVSIVLLLCVGATLAQDFMSPTLDILAEFKKIKTMEEKLNALNDEVRELRSKNEGTVKCMKEKSSNDCMKRQMKGSFHFSLFSLTFSYFGPHEEEITLVYVNANTGNFLLLLIGIFTSPVKGVYFFNFGVYSGFSQSQGKGVSAVCVNLYPDFWLFDSDYHHSTFSGHLLYPM
uniref:C1q domain-containing protein n=1 Tax=Cyprinus carpio TaxID=7962 RepID=A0A8C2E353_CYPCA